MSEQENEESLYKLSPLAPRAALYCAIPGIGPLTLAIRVVYVPEIGQQTSDNSGGLAPWSRDSGNKRVSRTV